LLVVAAGDAQGEATGLEGPDINSRALGPADAALILGRGAGAGAGIDGRAAGQQGEGLRGAAVVARCGQQGVGGAGGAAEVARQLYQVVAPRGTEAAAVAGVVLVVGDAVDRRGEDVVDQGGAGGVAGAVAEVVEVGAALVGLVAHEGGVGDGQGAVAVED